jgi:hypothetical protein
MDSIPYDLIIGSCDGYGWTVFVALACLTLGHPVRSRRNAGRAVCAPVGERAVEISQVRYFLAVAKELNFTRAAEECNVTQPALSRAIKLLEDEFGGALFHRERRHTHLTELGRMVETYLEGVFENSRQAKQIADEYVHLKKTPSGSSRRSAPATQA